MAQANQTLPAQPDKPATFGVVPATPTLAKNQPAPTSPEDRNTPGFRFSMKVWFGVWLFFWALLIWDLVYAILKH
jgi:hypothetical protein